MAKLRSDDEEFLLPAKTMGMIAGVVAGFALGYPLLKAGIGMAAAAPDTIGASLQYMARLVVAGATGIGGWKGAQVAGDAVLAMPNRAERQLASKMPDWDISVRPNRVVARQQFSPTHICTITVEKGKPPLVRDYYRDGPPLQLAVSQQTSAEGQIRYHTPVKDRDETSYNPSAVHARHIGLMQAAMLQPTPGERLRQWAAAKAGRLLPRTRDETLYDTFGLPKPMPNRFGRRPG